MAPYTSPLTTSDAFKNNLVAMTTLSLTSYKALPTINSLWPIPCKFGL